MFTAALLTVAKYGNNLSDRQVDTEDVTHNICVCIYINIYTHRHTHIHNIEYYSAVKRNRMDLDGIMIK